MFPTSNMPNQQFRFLATHKVFWLFFGPSARFKMTMIAGVRLAKNQTGSSSKFLPVRPTQPVKLGGKVGEADPQPREGVDKLVAGNCYDVFKGRKIFRLQLIVRVPANKRNKNGPFHTHCPYLFLYLNRSYLNLWALAAEGWNFGRTVCGWKILNHSSYLEEPSWRLTILPTLGILLTSHKTIPCFEETVSDVFFVFSVNKSTWLPNCSAATILMTDKTNKVKSTRATHSTHVRSCNIYCAHSSLLASKLGGSPRPGSKTIVVPPMFVTWRL